MTYIDGFVVPVPTANKEAYRAFVQKMVPYFKKYGALSMTESWGEEVPPGEETSFPSAVNLKPDETVVFSWIVWPDKATRDASMTSMYEEMEADGLTAGDPPFEGKRMIFGGFEPLVNFDNER